MDITTLARRAGDVAARLGAWALRRARERSTWAGLAMLAGALGHEALAQQLGRVGDGLAVLLAATGGGLAAASTSHPPVQP